MINLESFERENFPVSLCLSMSTLADEGDFYQESTQPFLCIIKSSEDPGALTFRIPRPYLAWSLPYETYESAKNSDDPKLTEGWATIAEDPYYFLGDTLETVIAWRPAEEADHTFFQALADPLV